MRWVAVAAGLAAASMLVVPGGASARSSGNETVTLDPMPAVVAPGLQIPVSGVTNPPGAWVNVLLQPTGDCLGSYITWWGMGADATTGVYSGFVTAPLTQGTYGYWALNMTDGGDGYQSSGCRTVKVDASLVPLPAAAAPTFSGPDRYGYCSAAGNTKPDGSPFAPGTFLNLRQGKPPDDEHYTGATPAFWVEGVGITCDLSPAQAALAAASQVKVNHVGATSLDEGPPFYTFVPSP